MVPSFLPSAFRWSLSYNHPLWKKFPKGKEPLRSFAIVVPNQTSKSPTNHIWTLAAVSEFKTPVVGWMNEIWFLPSFLRPFDGLWVITILSEKSSLKEKSRSVRSLLLSRARRRKAPPTILESPHFDDAVSLQPCERKILLCLCLTYMCHSNITKRSFPSENP